MSEHLRFDDDVTRHRCNTPRRPLCNRSFKLGRLHECECGRVYRLDVGPFGRRWSVIFAPDDVPIGTDVRSAVPR